MWQHMIGFDKVIEASDISMTWWYDKTHGRKFWHFEGLRGQIGVTHGTTHEVPHRVMMSYQRLAYWMSTLYNSWKLETSDKGASILGWNMVKKNLKKQGR